MNFKENSFGVTIRTSIQFARLDTDATPMTEGGEMSSAAPDCDQVHR